MSATAEDLKKLKQMREARGIPTPPIPLTQQEMAQVAQNATVPRIPTTMDMLQQYVIDPLTSRLPQNIVSMLPDIGETAGELAGMAEGARRGSLIPGGPAVKAGGTAIGGLIGAVLGTATGDTLRQLFQGESDPLISINKALESGIFSSAGEVISLFGDAGRAIERIRKNRQLEAEELQAIVELQEELQKIGITLTPAQLTNSGLQQTLEKIAVVGFGGEGKFGQLYEAQEIFIREKLQSLVKQSGNPDRELTGQMFKTALEDADDDLIQWAAPKYANLDKVAKDVRLSMQSTEQTLRNAKKKAMLDRKPGESSRLDSEVETMYDMVLGNTRNLSFSSLFDTISSLTREQRKVAGRIDNRNPTLEKAYRDTIESLLEDAKNAVKKSGDRTVLDLYDEVTDVYKASKESLHNSALTSIVSKEPEFVGSQIYATGNTTTVKAAFAAIDEAAESAKRVGKKFDAESLKNDLRAGYLRKLFVKADINETSTEAASQLLRTIAGDDEVGDTFNAMLTPQMIGQVKRVLGWANTLEKQSAGNFSLIVRGRQSGAFNQAVNEVGNAGTAGFSPFIIASAFSLIASPLFLAKRAIDGKASQEYLRKMKDFTTKYDQGKLDYADVASFLMLLSNDVSEDEELPEGLQIPKLNAVDSLKYHALKAHHAKRQQDRESTKNLSP